MRCNCKLSKATSISIIVIWIHKRIKVLWQINIKILLESVSLFSFIMCFFQWMIELQLLSLRALIFIFNITMIFYSKNHDSQPTVSIESTWRVYNNTFTAQSKKLWYSNWGKCIDIKHFWRILMHVIFGSCFWKHYLNSGNN